MSPERQGAEIDKRNQEFRAETSQQGTRPKTPETDAVRNGRFARDTQFYFEDLHGAGLYDEDDTRAYAEKMRAELDSLVKPDNPDSLQPTDYAISLGKLTGQVAENYTDSNPVNQKESDERKARARAVFMEAGKRLFPDTKVDVKSDLYYDTDRLLQLDRPREAAVELLNKEYQFSYAGVQDLNRRDPAELLRRLDEVISAGTHFATNSWEAFQMENNSRHLSDTGGERKQEKNKGKLAKATEIMYRLQLMREQLQAQLNGRKDVTPGEEREINKARLEIHGPESPSGPEQKK